MKKISFSYLVAKSSQFLFSFEFWPECSGSVSGFLFPHEIWCRPSAPRLRPFSQTHFPGSILRLPPGILVFCRPVLQRIGFCFFPVPVVAHVSRSLAWAASILVPRAGARYAEPSLSLAFPPGAGIGLRFVFGFFLLPA
jgi:hypothetical protein